MSPLQTPDLRATVAAQVRATPQSAATLPPTAPVAATSPPSSQTGIVGAAPAAQPTATAGPRNQTVWIGNTDGQGAYLRRTPTLADRISPAYPDRTPLTVISDDVDGDGQRWHHVRTSDGTEGYVPVIYTLTVEPTVVVRAATAVPTPVPTAPLKPIVPPATLAPVPAAQTTCGAPPNPWGYNFCGRGAPVRAAPSNLCSYFSCIPSSWNSTNGYVAQCADGMFSHSGGVRGACSGHGGVARALNGP